MSNFMVRDFDDPRMVYIKRRMLIDVLPREFAFEFQTALAWKYRYVQVIAKREDAWPGKEKYVNVWWELENGYAVGWTENPARGWSFPLIKFKYQQDRK